MNGVFGKWDFVVNGILFTSYHLHKFWEWPTQVLIRDWTYAWAAKRFKSYWVSVLIHGFDALALIIVFPMAIMGLLQ
jgi:membrane protease YdiL (CAAX protease family)